MDMGPEIIFADLQSKGLKNLTQPVKVTGFAQTLFNDLDFAAMLQATQLPITNNYLDDLSAGRRHGVPQHHMMLADYLAAPAPADSSKAREMVLEAPVPPAILERIYVPHSLHPMHEKRFFAGRPGCCADFHFDWVSHWLLQVPLFGRKHFAFLPTSAGSVMDAPDNLARLNLRDYTLEQWASFLEQHGGVQFILKPGEGLLQPPFWWHCVNYLEPAASISIGVGAVDPMIEAILTQKAPRDWRLATLFQQYLAGGEAAKNSQAMVEAIYRSIVKNNSTAIPQQR